MDIYEEIVKLRQAGRCGAVATIAKRSGIDSFVQNGEDAGSSDDGTIAGTIEEERYVEADVAASRT